MLIVHAERGKAICLGREGENLARQVVFDIYEWQELYGKGVVQLIAQRMGDTTPYPCAVEMDGNHAVWTITNADTARPGNYGKCELSYYVGDTLVKSETYATVVLDALGEPSEEPPEPYENWLENILSAGSDAELERIKAEEAANNAAKSEENASFHASDALITKQEVEKTAETVAGYAKDANNSAILAKGYSDDAEKSSQNASVSETNAKLHETNSGNSASAAALSEKNTAALVTEAKTAKEDATAEADRAEAEADRAEAAVDKYPKVQNGTWWVWDTTAGKYVDTGVKAEGGVGPRGPYYTPAVTQPTTDTMKVSYTPSASDMPSVGDVTVNLPKGKDGTTPHIGENGNWFIGEVDTGVSAGGSGDSDIFVVKITCNEEDQSQNTMDRTFEELSAARLELKVIEAEVYGTRYPLAYTEHSYADRSIVAFVFGFMSPSYDDPLVIDSSVVRITKDEINVIYNTVYIPGGDGVVSYYEQELTEEEQAQARKNIGAAGEKDVVLVPETASVGQAIVVKAVDESGKPTEWETVDLGPKLLGEITLTNENCTLPGDARFLHLNDELASQNMSLFSKIEQEHRAIFGVISLAGTFYYVTMNYVSATGTDDTNRGVQFYFINNPGDASLYTFGLTKNMIVTNYTDVSQAVIGGYPLTVRVYAL